VRTTIFSTPILTPVLRAFAIAVLKITRWQAIGKEFTNPRLVLIAAPHTSNWDFPLMLLVVLKLRLEVFWMGKDSLFKFPFGPMMKWLGGIPIDRSKANNVVTQITEEFAQNDKLVVLIPPEGTRSKVDQWKSGFYHIARNANVPILLGYVDAPKKEAGLADFYIPTGDLDKDMEEIRQFYAGKGGIRPENA